MNPAVLLFEWNRPRYARICVDSLLRARCPWPIILSLDKSDVPADAWPKVDRVFRFPGWAGNLWHVVRSLDTACAAGYDPILFMDGDMIVKTTIFQHIPDTVPPGVVFWSCRKGKYVEDVYFSPHGNLVTPATIGPVLEYCYRHDWVGKRHVNNTGRVLDFHFPHYDGVFFQHLRDTGGKSRFQERSLLGHIGLVGEDAKHGDQEAELFAGPPEQWLDNAIRMYKPGVSPFYPDDFAYE